MDSRRQYIFSILVISASVSFLASCAGRATVPAKEEPTSIKRTESVEPVRTGAGAE
jgi:uncharacterized lipoprotein YajG